MSSAIDPWASKPHLPQVTPRSIVAGLAIGSLVLVSNFQFGLQTGWVLMMLLPSALLAFAVFRSVSSSLGMPFTDVENVFVQSVSVSVGTGPLCFSFVGIVPAIEKFLTPEETGFGRAIRFSISDLIVWSVALGFFGIFFAVPLRRQMVVKEKLPFPSGSATATLISVLHQTEVRDLKHLTIAVAAPNTYRRNMRSMLVAFVISSVYTLLSYFMPFLRALPIFGRHMSKAHLWNFQPSPAYVGQGIIMGLPTVSHMLFGAILGWAILAPLAQYKGWASGPVGDWKTGAQGWVLWISLCIMVCDSIVSFLAIAVKGGLQYYRESKSASEERALLLSDNNEDDSEEEVDAKFLVPTKVTVMGIILSSVVCAVGLKLLFTIAPLHVILWSIVLAFFFSILAVRALGETDLNPVSGIGKLSQLIVALIMSKKHPAGILTNLVAGGIAEAGAQQAGDLMQDLKTGHLLGASPRCQFYAQLIGTVWSIILSSVMYRVYNTVYDIPNDLFRIPTAVIWVDCARLVTGAGLPDHVWEFSVVLGFIFGVIALIKNTVPRTSKYYSKLVWLPSGVPVGIGLYNIPSFTLARFVGGVLAYYWLKQGGKGNRVDMIIASSGLVLGEGFFGIINMVMANFRVPHM